MRLKPDVAALASLDRNKLCVLVWHYHDDDVSGPAAEVELELSRLPVRGGRATLRHFRIDDNHSNAFTEWRRMGSPAQTTSVQYARLEKAGQLAELDPPRALKIKDAGVGVTVCAPAPGHVAVSCGAAMKYRELGRTGWKVSEISFGAWAIGGAWGEVDDRESLAALHRAVDLGVNFFDTG